MPKADQWFPGTERGAEQGVVLPGTGFPSGLTGRFWDQRAVTGNMADVLHAAELPQFKNG